MWDKLNMTGSVYQLVNGIMLLFTFFSVRIVFGLYMSRQTYLSVMQVIDRVPTHLIIIYSVANVVLNLLNQFWFYKMVQMVQRRFRAGPSSSAKGRIEKAKQQQPSLAERKEQ
ncbi:hypothetical protein BGW41_006302 [Actinomortierella wolfii]|nr:hypothetical protein BGW41_006302 [Actinomortierella wolfii]